MSKYRVSSKLSLATFFLIAGCSSPSQCEKAASQIVVKEVALKSAIREEERTKKKSDTAADLFNIMALEWEQSMRECRGETRDTCAAHFAYEFSNHLEGLSVEMPVYKAGEEKDQWKAKETIEEILENFAEPIRSEYQETRSVRLQLKEELDNLIRSSECD